MRRPWRITFRRLMAVCLLIACVTTTLWISSDIRPSRLTFHPKAGVRYALHSYQGSLAFEGPPRGGSAAPAVTELVSRLRNDDFTWRPPEIRRGQWDVQGNVRDGTATRAMFDQFGDKAPGTTEVRRAERLLLVALEDPDRFIPAHMMLSRVRGHWRDANVTAAGLPCVFMRADVKDGTPDYSLRPMLLTQWHDELDEPYLSVRYMWLLIGSLLLPIGSIASSRRARRTTWHVAFASVSLASFLVGVFALAMWVRSHRYLERLNLPPKPIPAPAITLGASQDWHRTSQLTSVGGNLQLYMVEIPVYAQTRAPSGPYRRMPRPKIAYVSSKFGAYPGEHLWRAPGLTIHTVPAHTVYNRPVPVRINGQTIMMGGTGLAYHTMTVLISWWWVIALMTLLPIVWIRTQLRAWRRKCGDRNQHLCANCGYDLRATPHRCPECGCVPASAAPTTASV